MTKYYLAGQSMAMSLAEFTSGVMGWERVRSIEDADVLCFSGGADVDPSLYNEKSHWSTHSWPDRDHIEYQDLLMFLSLDKTKVLGICRGAQFLTAVTGGKLIQNVNNHAGSRHLMTTHDGQEVRVNSVHHQMCLPDMDFTQLLGWGQGVATMLEGLPKDQLDLAPGTFPEPEAFRILTEWNIGDVDALCFQYHPEFGSIPADGLEWTKQTTLGWIQS